MKTVETSSYVTMIHCPACNEGRLIMRMYEEIVGGFYQPLVCTLWQSCRCKYSAERWRQARIEALENWEQGITLDWN